MLKKLEMALEDVLHIQEVCVLYIIYELMRANNKIFN